MRSRGHGASVGGPLRLRAVRQLLIFLAALTVFCWGAIDTVLKMTHADPPHGVAPPTTYFDSPPPTPDATVSSAPPSRQCHDPGNSPPRIGPSTIAIPALHVQAPIVPVTASHASGSTASVVLNPPAPRLVGQYAAGATITDSHGTVLIIGHVNFNGVRGAFSDLSQIRQNADIWVSNAAGLVTHWRAYANPVYAKNSPHWPVDVLSKTGAHRLVLISCTGALHWQSGYGYSYDDNQFVYAAPVAAC